ncbi:MAG: glycosyltransferase [Parcubacteria group bacterium]|nr:glycosyltransferase [Parcubacteria group bacterium]
MKIALCLLTYNEVGCVRLMIPSLDFSSFDEVFAVDGGSIDGTLDVYRNYGIRIVAQPSRGRGEAFRLAEKSTDADAIVYFSPDGNEDPSDFPKFRHFLEEGMDIVIASRMMKGAFNEEDISLWRPRKWVNNFFNWAANILWNKTKVYITDSINGYRAIRRGLVNKLGQDAMGYTIEYQNTIRAMKNGLKIVEFPTREGQRIYGKTKATSLKTGIVFLHCLLREVYLGGRQK